MGGLIFIAVVIIWFSVSLFLARKIACGPPIKSSIAKGIIGVIAFALIFPLPLIDEIIGKIQFDKLCREEAGVKIFGKLELGPEFFNADGTPNFEVSRGELDERVKQIAEVDTFKHERITSPVDLNRGTFLIVDKRTGQELIRTTGFNNRGGWLAFDHSSWLTSGPCYPQVSQIDLLKSISVQKTKE